MMKGIRQHKKEFIAAALFGFTIFAVLYYVFLYPNRLPGDSQKVFEIKKGKTLHKIADELYDAGIIPNKRAFMITAYFMGADKKIKAGEYVIKSGLNYIELVEIFTKGVKQNQIKVTIPEGIWQHKLASLIAKEMKIDSLEFLRLSFDKQFLSELGVEAGSLEGYLLPETYFFFKGSSVSQIIKRLKQQNDKIFDVEAIQRMKNLSMTKHEILTLASVIEGETNKFSEYRAISGVYHNRLRIGMKLQADPTVQYLKRYSNSYNRILYRDLEIDSPYNTYKYQGLPPGPINNPGREAILAALYPEEHRLLYFVADGTGGHKFAATYSEHLRNQARYREWRRTQQ